MRPSALLSGGTPASFPSLSLCFTEWAPSSSVWEDVLQFSEAANKFFESDLLWHDAKLLVVVPQSDHSVRPPIAHPTIGLNGRVYDTLWSLGWPQKYLNMNRTWELAAFNHSFTSVYVFWEALKPWKIAPVWSILEVKPSQFSFKFLKDKPNVRYVLSSWVLLMMIRVT